MERKAAKTPAGVRGWGDPAPKRRGGSPARPRKAKPPGAEINRRFYTQKLNLGTFSVPSSDFGGIFILIKSGKFLFESKIYVIHWIYESGYCEISNHNGIKLVKLSDLTPLE